LRQLALLLKYIFKGEQENMVSLSEFSKDDLKKFQQKISEQLKKVDETSFDPRESEEKTTHNEEDLGGTSKKITDKDAKTEKSVETKKDFPPEHGDGSEEMTGPTQGDVMSQILAALKEIAGKLDALAPKAPMPEPAPVDQIQQSATPPGPVATPSTTPAPTETKVPEKGDININVTKQQVEEILKGMGITPSEIAKKPKQDTEHPIAKGNDVTYDKIKKMSWDEVHNVNDEINPRPYY